MLLPAVSLYIYIIYIYIINVDKEEDYYQINTRYGDSRTFVRFVRFFSITFFIHKSGMERERRAWGSEKNESHNVRGR